MRAFEGNYLAGDPVAQMEWRQRQIRIARAILMGESVTEVAAKEGVTAERIRQIIQMARLHAIKLPRGNVRLPTCNRWGMAALRAHRVFWLARFEALEREWNLPTEKPLQTK